MNTATEEMTIERLTEEFGCSRAWWVRYRPAMVEAGVIAKRGRKFWGSISDVGMWLRGQPKRNPNTMDAGR